jgi:hypothetical protein
VAVVLGRFDQSWNVPLNGNVFRIALLACGIGLSAAWTALLGFWIFHPLSNGPPKQPGNQKSQKPIRKPTRTSADGSIARPSSNEKFQQSGKENDHSSTMNTAGELKLWILTLAVRHSRRTRAAACGQICGVRWAAVVSRWAGD